MKFEKYRKKPIVIDAIRFDMKELMDKIVKDKDNNPWFEKVKSWTCTKEKIEYNGVKLKYTMIVMNKRIERIEIIIDTLEGEHLVSDGDFIIRGVKGEYYPCKPDIFELTYDKVIEK